LEITMADYRIDLLNGSGRVVQQSNANCADDGEACALARRLLGFGERAEVWIEGRCAGRVSATSAAEVEMFGRAWAAPQAGQT